MKNVHKIIAVLLSVITVFSVSVFPSFSAEYGFILGDLNSDGTVSPADSLMICRFVLSKFNFYSPAGDINSDGFVNSRDNLYLKAYFAGAADLSAYDGGTLIHSVQICGRDISGYSVYSPDENAANLLSDYVKTVSGITLPRTYNSDASPIIRFIRREGGGFEYYTDADNLIICGDENGLLRAADDISERFFGYKNGNPPTSKRRFAEIPRGISVKFSSEAEDFSAGLSNFVGTRGKYGTSFDGHEATVFTLGKDCQSAKVSECVIAYELMFMAFPYTSKDISAVTVEVMELFPDDSAEYEELKALRSNMTSSFKKLYSSYGPFSAEGVDKKAADGMHADENFLKFSVNAAKMADFCRSHGIPCVLFDRLSPDELYKISKSAFEFFKDSEIKDITWTYGADSVTLTVSDPGAGELLPIWRTLFENGFDVWVFSDLERDILRGAVDAFGLHPYCTGVAGSAAAMDNGHFTAAFDRENCYPSRACGNGKWFFDMTPLGDIPGGNIEGAVNTVFSEYYGKSPAAVFAVKGGGLSFDNLIPQASLAVIYDEKTKNNDVFLSNQTNTGFLPEAGCKNYTSEINIMSLNIRCGGDSDGHSIEERRPRVKDTVKRLSPDVIGFQEVTPEWLDRLHNDYGDIYEIFNVWRDTEELESAPILWKKEKFLCRSKGVFWLSDTPDVMSDGYDPVRRACQYAVLTEIETGKSFVFMNTHVGFIEANQAKSCEVIKDFAKEFSALPVFITGDFNFQPGTLGYTAMTEYFTDMNAAARGDTGETFHGYYHGYEPTELVDYCFVSHSVTPVDCEVMRETFDGKFASDHYALKIRAEY